MCSWREESVEGFENRARADSAVLYRFSRRLCFSKGLWLSGDVREITEWGDKGKPKVWLVVGVLLHGRKLLTVTRRIWGTYSGHANLPETLLGVKRETERASSPSSVTSRGQREWGVKREHSWRICQDVCHGSLHSRKTWRAGQSRSSTTVILSSDLCKDMDDGVETSSSRKNWSRGNLQSQGQETTAIATITIAPGFKQ